MARTCVQKQRKPKLGLKPSTHKALDSKPTLHKPGIVAHARIPVLGKRREVVILDYTGSLRATYAT